MKERNPSTKLCVDFPVMPVLDHRSRFGCSAGYGDTAKKKLHALHQLLSFLGLQQWVAQGAVGWKCPF